LKTGSRNVIYDLTYKTLWLCGKKRKTKNKVHAKAVNSNKIMIEVITIPVGFLETNCYLLYDSESKEAFCVDPGGDPEKIIEAVEDSGLTLKGVLLTHGHGDHIGGLSKLLAEHDVPLYVHPEDKEMLGCPHQNLSGSIGLSVTAPPTDKFVEDGRKIPFGNTEISVIHTPGHTRGGVSYFVHPDGENPVLFSGDTLFYLEVGRIDLPGGSWESMQESIRNKLYVLPDETTVYPGHGPATTILREKHNNPYVRID